jgi:hypothetical protein
MEKTPPEPPTDPTACERCGGSLVLGTVIQRLGSEPGYRIFRCTRCTAMKWIPTAGPGDDVTA